MCVYIHACCIGPFLFTEKAEKEEGERERENGLTSGSLTPSLRNCAMFLRTTDWKS